MSRFSKHLPPLESLILPAIVVLVGVSAFGLGRLSAVAGEAPAASAGSAAKTSGTYVASKSGTKYYLPSCAPASIKDANKVWFDTAAEAQAAGYTPASNCSGL